MSLEENLKELEALRRMVEGGLAFGQEIRHARTSRGMTLDALAAATGIAKSYLSQIETGYALRPRDEKVRRIAGALGLNEEALVAQSRLAQLPSGAKERIARLAQLAHLREMFDSTEEMIRALLAAKESSEDHRAPAAPAAPPAETAAAPAPSAPAARDAGAARGEDARGPVPAAGTSAAPAPAATPGPPPALNLDALHRSGLLHHLAEWGADRVDDRHSTVRRVPIINKVAAGYPQEFTDLGYPVGVADEYITVPAEMDDPSAFAVRVVGDSMEPRYREGDIVIFSPAARVRSGDDCFVRFGMTGCPSEGASTFKRVFFDADERVRLQPLNEQHAPAIVRPADIAGVFRAVARYEKL
ncbi:MAG: LexA family transcriptional regulator [Planctomycetes bacterium]|nr:LexA family transcriptional regulator [Planctomycetota bacterium]